MTIILRNDLVSQDPVTNAQHPLFSAKSHRHLAEIATDETQRARHLELAELAEDRARWLDSFLAHLHRGGTYAYYWRPHVTRWYETNRRRPAADASKDCYFGIHPCRFIPQTNSKGEPKPAHQVRGQTEAISAINCVFAEFDAKDFACLAEMLQHVYGLEPEPTALVFSSNRGLHAYWLLDEPFYTVKTEDRERARRLQAAWVARTGGDPGAKDLARVLRLPGTVNTKYTPAEPVRFADYHPERTYTFDELEALATPQIINFAEFGTIDNLSSQNVVKNQPNNGKVELHDHATDMERALAALAPRRADGYDEWLTVGMAIHDAGLPFALWDTWSAQSAKHQDEGNARLMQVKWASFTQGRGITIKTVYKWAHEDTPGWHVTRQEPAPEVKQALAVAPREPKADLPARLNICGVVVWYPDPDAPDRLKSKTLVCGDYRNCENCAELKARDLLGRIEAALGRGPLCLARTDVKTGRGIVRRHGKDNVLRIPLDGGEVVIFNPDTGMEILPGAPPALGDILALVRAMPENKRISGHLGQEDEPGTVEPKERAGSPGGEDAEKILVKMIAHDADRERAQDIYNAAWARTKDKVLAMRLTTAVDVENALDIITTEYKHLLRMAGFTITQQVTRETTVHLARIRDWKDTYALNHTGGGDDTSRTRQRAAT